MHTVPHYRVPIIGFRVQGSEEGMGVACSGRATKKDQEVWALTPRHVNCVAMKASHIPRNVNADDRMFSWLLIKTSPCGHDTLAASTAQMNVVDGQ